MEHALIISKLEEINFLRTAEKHHYHLIQTPFIETLHWDALTPDDLKQMPERSVWQDHERLYALRNDFTDQLVRYYQQYNRHHNAVAYSGTIVRHQHIQTQLGLEWYEPTIQEMHYTFSVFFKYIQEILEDQIDYIVIGHYELVQLLLNDTQPNKEITMLIEQRNISGLTLKLGLHHPIVQLLLTPTHQQLEKLNQLFDSTHHIIAILNRWEAFFHSLDIDNVHLDLTPQPPRSYYKGIFIHAKLAQRELLLQGGYYKGALEGFGLGLTL
ncbi:ATP phosphoribosyltransferase regulatory subunit [Staphylococcus sp. 17KM0847]|uniref:ATP phosphoribosyltransferase regulatory subunit n=1 Tax=Staphylococcus sp. 17KM0847 TaxID=2583989 RepID=UPI0015DC719F|nr:ATP phosphoribosyltransferase regulatory subunit [Staphylococcus sp. 17KM0847]QLK86843.1 ATP phosphoribosyltransferase regulatory subunit [Staphylococcus sp. 17KM0847]